MTSSKSIEYPDAAPAQDLVIPVLEERLHVGKRLVESTRARVHITVSEHEQAVEALLMHQDVGIERVPVDRQVDVLPPVRTEGDTVIVSVIEERLVVVKQLFVKEELRIRIRQMQQPVTETGRVRREHAEIEDYTNPGEQ